MPTRRPQEFYDAHLGSKLLNIEQAADYLGYNRISLYRVVARGALVPVRAGKTLLFNRDELDRYKLQNAWAAKKAHVEMSKEPLPALPATLTAEVSVDLVGGGFGTTVESIKEFSWAMIPEVRARIDSQYGNVSFAIEVKGPDGGFWMIDYRPPTWIDRLKSRLRRRK